MLNNKYSDSIYESFIKLYEQNILIQYPSLKQYNIDLSDDAAGHLPNNWKDNENHDPSPYTCDTELMSIVRYNKDTSILTDDNMHFALIAHEIGHFFVNITQPDTDADKVENGADDFAVSIGLTIDLIRALIKCIDLINNQNVDPVMKMLLPPNHHKKQIAKLNNRIARLKQILDNNKS